MRELRFFNSLGRELQKFDPQEPGKVRIYTCGPTVYGTSHIGNLRTFLFEDILCRALGFFGLEVEQVMNLTDVEDKIIAGAVERGLTIDDYVAPHIDSFFRDIDRLHIRRAQLYPRATEHVEEMIALIESLLAKDFAYEAEGSIFFRIENDEDYGRLSGIDRSQLRRGERVADDEYEKEDVRDFVLWKGAKQGEPSWPSPWGPGRPGWHIECSAMSMKYLGKTLDMHCGGVDNAFPHHENEIAQSESATGELFARFWLHSEHLLVDGAKMSKSLGNQYTLDDLIEKVLSLRAVRYLFLSVHYRHQLNFTFRSLENAAAALRRVDEMFFRLGSAKEATESSRVERPVADLEEEFSAALADDLNLSAALAAVHTFIRDVNSTIEANTLGAGDKARVDAAMRRVDEVLGVLFSEEWAPSVGQADEVQPMSGLGDIEIEDLIVERSAARGRRDWAEADRIRDLLKEEGVVIEDLREGARWKRT
jgi:cysteinyl-tRNA synthetase